MPWISPARNRRCIAVSNGLISSMRAVRPEISRPRPPAPASLDVRHVCVGSYRKRLQRWVHARRIASPIKWPSKSSCPACLTRWRRARSWWLVRRGRLGRRGSAARRGRDRQGDRRLRGADGRAWCWRYAPPRATASGSARRSPSSAAPGERVASETREAVEVGIPAGRAVAAGRSENPHRGDGVPPAKGLAAGAADRRRARGRPLGGHGSGPKDG